MRAQILEQHGGPEMLHMSEIDKPVVKEGEVLIRVHASSVNPVDLKIREGLPIGPALPAILGADLAGVVDAVGPGVTGFAVGDEVFGCAGGVRGLGGALAEYIAADARLIAPKPRSLSFREAAALPLVSITAWEAIERVQPQPGETLLVHGAVGGVGHIAAQLAALAGVEVSGTVGKNEDFGIAKQMGVANPINHRNELVAEYVERLTNGRGFDAVIDTVGGQNLVQSFEAAAIGARVATTNARASIDLSQMHAKALSLHLVFMLLPMLNGAGREKHGHILREIAALADNGQIRPRIDPERFTLAGAADAHRHLAERKAQGKVVIEID